MNTVIKSLSSLNSRPWKSGLNSASYKQFKRNYQDGFVCNFVFALSGFNDFKSKEYSNFYLTDNIKASNFIDFKKETGECFNFLTYINVGGSYLSRPDQITYKGFFPISFKQSLDETTYFDIEFYENNLCSVSFQKNGKKCYLVQNQFGNAEFKWDLYIPDSKISEYGEQYFKYTTNSKNELFLIKGTESGVNKILKRDKNDIKFVDLLEQNKYLFLTSDFKISRLQKYNLDITPNTSFITYANQSVNIDINKSDLELNNNFLINSPHASDYKNVIVLKNQLTVTDVFTNGNSLLSSGYDIAVDNFRNYTKIINPIDSENSYNISLNYVFYNKPYVIKKGITEFTTPSSMYPFTNLNINDTKFVKSGAYAFNVPEYADKIYQLNTNNYQNDRSVYLCTWLSGSREKSVWVDRYYYPDLIQKQEALLTKGVFDITYDQLIENLIASNSNLKIDIADGVIFDKKSDLSFKPNQTYRYHRFDNYDLFNTLTPTNKKICNYNATPSNYQLLINEKGQLTVGFHFKGDESNWIIKSARNNIDAGLRIQKIGDIVEMEYRLFDNSTNETLIFKTSDSFKKLKYNFICFSYDALNGDGFFFMNNEKLLTIQNTPGRFSNKKILYGELFLNSKNILDYNTSVSDVFISDEKIDEDLAFIIPFIQNKESVDDIIITLPCGMRNAIDDISYIQSTCNSLNKSNYIDISINNLDISNPTILEDIKTYIMSEVKKYTPATTNINTIKFSNNL